MVVDDFFLFFLLVVVLRVSYVLLVVLGRECVIGIFFFWVYIFIGFSFVCEWYFGLCLLKNVGEGNGCSDGVCC